MGTELHSYQQEAVDFIMGREGAAVFADPGLGKTLIALTVADTLRVLYGARTLVVTPLRPMYSTWPNEIEKWADLRGLTHQILHGAKEKVINPDADITLINPEGLAKYHKALERAGFGFLVVDESSKFKNWTAVRTMKLKRVAKKIPKRMIMTGTPAPNSLLDLFPQIFICDLGKSLGTAITNFREEHFYAADFHRRKWEPFPETEEFLHNATGHLCLRLDGEKLLELPERVLTDIPVDIPEERREEYKAIEKKLFTAVDAGDESIFVESKKESPYLLCRQFSSGFLYRKTLRDKGGNEVVAGSPAFLRIEAREAKRAQRERREINYERAVVEIHKEKIEALRDLIDELHGKPVVVIFNFHHERTLIETALGRMPCIASGTSAKRGKEIEAAWTRGEIDKLLVHPVSVSHGLNLQYGKGRHMIWFSLTDDLETYQQLNARIHRQGVDGRVFIYHLVGRDTIEEAIRKRLNQKTETQLSLLEAIEEYRNANCNRGV